MPLPTGWLELRPPYELQSQCVALPGAELFDYVCAMTEATPAVPELSAKDATPKGVTPLARHPQLLDHRPYRPWQIDPGRPADPAPAG